MDQPRDLIVRLVDLLGRGGRRQVEELIKARLAHLPHQAGHALPMEVGREIQRAVRKPAADLLREDPQLVFGGPINFVFHDFDFQGRRSHFNPSGRNLRPFRIMETC